jgi:hypothetical protein
LPGWTGETPVLHRQASCARFFVFALAARLKSCPSRKSQLFVRFPASACFEAAA